jgi:23S rRNA pseudouridine955/2504/2580 synthase
MLPNALLRFALKARDVRVNGVKCDCETTVHPGDRVDIFVNPQYLHGAPVVLWEGEGLLALNKPAGLPVDVDEHGIGEDTLIARARAVYPTAQLCHRLDANTGGIILLAINENARIRTIEAFKRNDVDRVYACLVKGIPGSAEATLNAFLHKDCTASLVTVFDDPHPGAQPISAAYRLIGTWESVSELEVRLTTGRTHQIRAHLAHIGLPILGDDQYGDRVFNRALSAKRMALWCKSVAIWGHVIKSEARFVYKMRREGGKYDILSG